ncbi:hypothetical protein ABZY44_03235 [Streptomyces sp. NPDC006544]|uniref:hypothetical protein n=1 Tax=Streptomyces sp. NPDC006544 TaxID=3154583 RepID=UPI0033A474D2
MARRSRTREQRPAFGIPKEVILLTGTDVWPFTVVCEGWGGGCGKIRMTSDASPEDVQNRVFTELADYTRTHHGVEIEVAWSVLPPDSWVGHMRRVVTEEPVPPRATPEAG